MGWRVKWSTWWQRWSMQAGAVEKAGTHLLSRQEAPGERTKCRRPHLLRSAPLTCSTPRPSHLAGLPQPSTPPPDMTRQPPVHRWLPSHLPSWEFRAFACRTPQAPAHREAEAKAAQTGSNPGTCLFSSPLYLSPVLGVGKPGSLLPVSYSEEPAARKQDRRGKRDGDGLHRGALVQGKDQGLMVSQPQFSHLENGCDDTASVGRAGRAGGGLCELRSTAVTKVAGSPPSLAQHPEEPASKPQRTVALEVAWPYLRGEH